MITVLCLAGRQRTLHHGCDRDVWPVHLSGKKCAEGGDTLAMLSAKTAAHEGLDEAHAIVGKSKGITGKIPIAKGGLGGGPDGNPAILVAGDGVQGFHIALVA